MTERAVIALDPALRRTGACVYRIAEDGRLTLALAKSDTYRQRDRYGDLRVLLGAAVCTGRWFAVLEKPTPRGGGLPPTAAFHDWQAWLQDLARKGAAVTGERYRKPMILKPTASQWRSPLGLATRAPRGFSGHDERRAYLKGQAVRYARILTGGEYDEDTAEAVCMALWALRLVQAGGMAPKKGGGFEPIRYVV